MDMGDFAGGLLKYVREHPVCPRHHRGWLWKNYKAGARGQWICIRGAPRWISNGWQNSLLENLRDDVKAANTAQQVLEILGPGLAHEVAREAKEQVVKVLRGSPVAADVMIVDRVG